MTNAKSKMQFFFLMAVFILPLIVSMILFYFPNKFSFHTTNHGTLLNPPLVNQTLLLKRTQKKWQIVYVPDECGHENKMFILHQVRMALGKDQNRLMLTLADNESCKMALHDFRKVVLANNALTKRKIYLIDPIGNIFMSYPENTDPMNILKDLQKVLEVSQIG